MLWGDRVIPGASTRPILYNRSVPEVGRWCAREEVRYVTLPKRDYDDDLLLYDYEYDASGNHYFILYDNKYDAAADHYFIFDDY